MTTVGKRLAYTRQTIMNMSQKDFSDLIGSSQGALSAMENDNRGIPMEALVRLSEYSKTNSNISCDWILTGNNPMDDMQTKQLLSLYSELTETEQQIILHKTAEMYYERVRKTEMDSDKKPPMTDSSQQSSEEPPRPIPFAASGEADITPENYADIQMRLQKYDKRAKELEGK